jgi:signal transduction histidine kinase
VSERNADTAKGAALVAFVATAILLATVAIYGALKAGSDESGAIDAARKDVLVLARAIETGPADAPPDAMRHVIARLRLDLAAALYDENGGRLATVAASGADALLSALPATAPRLGDEARWTPVSMGGESASVLLLRLEDGRTLAVSHRARAAVSWARTLVAAQTLTIVVAMVLAALLIRRVRRAVQSRNDSTGSGDPTTKASARTEADFVVETFHSVIGELQVKGRELERKRLIERERADRSELFSERVIAQMPTGLVVVDHAGVVTAANPSARELFAALPTERGHAVRFEDAFREAPDLVHMVAVCAGDGVAFQRHEVEFRPPSGSLEPRRSAAPDSPAGGTRFLGVSVSPLGSRDGRPEGALCLMTDLTEVVALRDRVRLQDNLANLGEMAAGLTHELKNSLATIQGYSQLIARLAPGDAATPSQALVDEVRYLSQMVTDFLNFARPQDPNLVPVSLERVVREVIERVEDRAASAGITLAVEVELEARSARVLADETLLARALLNIVVNAVDVLETSEPPRALGVRVGVSTPGQGIVEIADSGPGIPTGDLSKIFIPFFTTKSRGHGIGLALTQKIIVTHRGDITVESDAAGTVFRCSLPLATD